MTTYTRPLVNGTPTTGQVVKAGHINEPIDQIYDTILAGGITQDQIAAGAVDTAELATAAVTRVKMDGTIPDGSAMATDAAPTLDAQLSNKKYADTKEAALVTQSTASIFGSWTDKDSGGSVALAKDEVYKASSDGFVTVVDTENIGKFIKGFTDSSSPPTTVRVADFRGSGGLFPGSGLSMPVRKDDFWKITVDAGSITIYWLPIGTGVSVKQ